MKQIRILIVIFISTFSIYASAQNATEIIKKADEKLKGQSSFAIMSIEIVRPKWSREMKMKSWSKGDDFSIILVTEPARDQGTVFLKREKEIWNWVPSIDRNIKLPPSMMTQSWMGTDFTNDDLVKQSSIVVDYNHKIIKDSTVQGYNCYVIELDPKPNAPVVWGKIKIWIEKAEYMQMRTEFYDEDGFLINIMNGLDVKDFNGKKLPSILEMIPVEKTGHKTIIKYQELKFDIDVTEDFFSTQNMKRLR